MVNSALMAKIHTVEWTPAILAHPALEIGMKANWWGLRDRASVSRDRPRSARTRRSAACRCRGVDHHGADYCLTEEFVSVYRMHPLMRDDLPVRSAADGRLLATVPTTEGVIGNQDQLGVFKSRGLGFHRRVLLVRRRQSRRRSRSTTIPNFLRELTTARRRGDRPRLDRHHARSRTRRAALQPVPSSFCTRSRSGASTIWPTRCIPACPRSCAASTARPTGATTSIAST